MYVIWQPLMIFGLEQHTVPNNSVKLQALMRPSIASTLSQRRRTHTLEFQSASSIHKERPPLAARSLSARESPGERDREFASLSTGSLLRFMAAASIYVDGEEHVGAQCLHMVAPHECAEADNEDHDDIRRR